MSMCLFDVPFALFSASGPVANGPNGAAISADGDMEVLPRAPRHLVSEKSQLPGSGCNNCGSALVPWTSLVVGKGQKLSPKCHRFFYHKK